jgi:hypothetical protein
MTWRVNLVKMPPPTWAGVPFEEQDQVAMMAPCEICGAEVYEPCLHVFCETHWRWTEIDEANCWSGRGFAGGGISHVAYLCGCQDHDESGDVAAAR